MPDTYPIGTLPTVGEVPQYMFAQVVRQERFGDPRLAFKVEKLQVPKVKQNEVLIATMAAGINYNKLTRMFLCLTEVKIG